MKVVMGYPNNILLGDVYWGTAGDALRSIVVENTTYKSSTRLLANCFRGLNYFRLLKGVYQPMLLRIEIIHGYINCRFYNYLLHCRFSSNRLGLVNKSCTTEKACSGKLKINSTDEAN